MPLISVIMCVYNEEKCLSESIESVLNQDLTDFELIIVDDDSTDRSPELIEAYRRRDDRILVIRTGKNVGPAKARNVALKKAEGKYVAILDADDVALPGRLKLQYQYLEQNMDIYLLGGYLIVIDGKGREKDVWKSKCLDRTELEEALPKRNCIAHSTVMFRNTHEFFYREKFEVSEEYDLYLNMLSSGKHLANIPRFLTKYRLRPTSLTFQQSAKIAFYASKAREFYQQRIGDGADGYDSFRPGNMPADECCDASIFNKINLALRMKDWALARGYLREYKKARDKRFGKYIFYYTKTQICRARELKTKIVDVLK